MNTSGILSTLFGYGNKATTTVSRRTFRGYVGDRPISADIRRVVSNSIFNHLSLLLLSRLT